MSQPRTLVVGTAGHIDHGKTALVRALTGVDTDRLPAERKRGISIDLGFASLEMDGVDFSLVDVPGHERFIRNMLAGATGLDLALLVVAADDSVMPQTREHLEILRLLGLARGVVALTKCDLAEPIWLEMVEEDVRTLAVGSFLDSAPIIKTSATSGMGLDDLRHALLTAADGEATRTDPGYFRLSIDRAFTIAGHGTVVTGTVASGSVQVGDELELWPEGRLVRVRGLQRHERPAQRVGRGTRAALNLVGVHHAEIRRGQELAEPGYLSPTRLLSVQVEASRDAPQPLRHRGRYRLHLGTAEVTATLALMEGNLAEPGRPILAQVATAAPVVAVSGQPFVLRAESPPATLGGGRILQPRAARIRRRDQGARERLGHLLDKDSTERAAAALAFAGYRPLSRPALSREAAVGREGITSCLERLLETGRLRELQIGPRRTIQLPSEVLAELDDRVLRALRRLHDASPRQTTIRRSHVAAELPDLAEAGLVGPLLDRLKSDARVVADDRTVALAEFRPRLSQNERKLKQELAASLRMGGLSPPSLEELTTGSGPRGTVVTELLDLLVAEGHAVEISRGLYLDADMEVEIRRRVLEALESRPDEGLTVAAIRDLLGTTRKYAVPFSEYLDRIGLTRRDGDLRYLGVGASETTRPDPSITAGDAP